MKKLIVGLVAGAALGGASAQAASTLWSAGQVVCRPAHMAGSGVVCVRSDGRGYGMGMTGDLVMVTNNSGRTVYVHRQPVQP